MNTDVTINIGSTHSVCQDYAIAGDGYVILSDGCSSSSDTDIGARLLVRAMAQVVTAHADISELHKESARVALAWARMIGLPAQSVDATLMSAHVSGDNLIVACSGDGVIVLESKEGVLDVYAISSPSGYPFYPSYVHQPDRLAELVTHNRCNKEIKHHDATEITDSLTISLKLKAADYRYVALASDGINSFFQTQRRICLADVLKELWSFKHSHGAFVERRMKRFKKDMHAKGWQHADDLAFAVINLGDEHVRQSSQNVLAR
jgi:protein phosphatase 2C-like protein